MDTMATDDDPRTAIKDVALDGVGAGLDAEAERGVEDVTLSATETACKTNPLLNWAEYRKVSL